MRFCRFKFCERNRELSDPRAGNTDNRGGETYMISASDSWNISKPLNIRVRSARNCDYKWIACVCVVTLQFSNKGVTLWSKARLLLYFLAWFNTAFLLILSTLLRSLRNFFTEILSFLSVSFHSLLSPSSSSLIPVFCSFRLVCFISVISDFYVCFFLVSVSL